MQRVYEGLDPLMAAHVDNVLRGEGILCTPRNQHLAAAVGGLPLSECWHELWVVDDTQADEARAVVRNVLSAAPAPAGSPWVCAGCGQAHGAQFTACWNCGRERAWAGGQVCST